MEDHPDLFAPNRLHRANDPQTSRKAAEAIAGKLTELQQVVLEWIRNNRGRTDREMVTALMQAIPGSSESTWRTRRAELVELGLVWKLGEVRDPKGRMHQTWCANERPILP